MGTKSKISSEKMWKMLLENVDEKCQTVSTAPNFFYKKALLMTVYKKWRND